MSTTQATRVPSTHPPHISHQLAPTALPAPWIAVSRFEPGEWKLETTADEELQVSLGTPIHLSKPQIIAPKYNFGHISKFVPLHLVCDNGGNTNAPIDSNPLFCATPVTPQDFATQAAKRWHGPHDLMAMFYTPNWSSAISKTIQTVPPFAVTTAGGEQEQLVSAVAVWLAAPHQWQVRTLELIKQKAFLFTVKQWQFFHPGDTTELARAADIFIKNSLRDSFLQFLANYSKRSQS